MQENFEKLLLQKVIEILNNLGIAETDIHDMDIGDYTYLYMVYDYKDKKFGLMAQGEGRAEIKINYCPICGKKLI